MALKNLKQVYPDNYKDHLKNRDHASEKNTFQWQSVSGQSVSGQSVSGQSVSDNNEVHPHLSIDSSGDRGDIKKLVKEFINSYTL